METDDDILIAGYKTDIDFPMTIKIGPKLNNSVVGNERVFLVKESLLLRKSSNVFLIELIPRIGHDIVILKFCLLDDDVLRVNETCVQMSSRKRRRRVISEHHRDSMQLKVVVVV